MRLSCNQPNNTKMILNYSSYLFFHINRLFNIYLCIHKEMEKKKKKFPIFPSLKLLIPRVLITLFFAPFFFLVWKLHFSVYDFFVCLFLDSMMRRRIVVVVDALIQILISCFGYEKFSFYWTTKTIFFINEKLSHITMFLVTS